MNATSARAGVGRTPVPLDEDHIRIAKPRKRDAQVYKAAKELLRDYVLRARSVEATSGPTTRRAPHELPPGALTFFGRETELAALTARLRAGKSTAVVGAAGVGKTALAGRALLDVVGETPGTLAASPFPDGVMYLDRYGFQGKAAGV